MQSRVLSALLVMLPALIGCGSDSTGPFVDPVAGLYTASLITNTTGDSTVDLIARGLTFELALEPDGSMNGHFVFTTGNDRPGLPFDIVGTWERTDAGLVITDIADSFVSHVRFDIGKDRLAGEGTVGESTLRMVLDREE